MVSTESSTYPYERVQDYLWFDGYEDLPKKVIDYLCDLPLPNYTPKTDNSYPRVRLMKYLYYDEPQPLSKPALTVAQKKSIIYDALHPTDAPDTEKGYRLYPLQRIAQAETAGKTTIRCYVSRVAPNSDMTAQVGVTFIILSNMAHVNNTKSTALDRTVAIEQSIIEALHGVNMTGVGTFYFDRRQFGECGSYAITDEYENVGRVLTMAVSWADSTLPPHTER